MTMQEHGGRHTSLGETAGSEIIAPLPRVSIQAFCETPEIARLIEQATGDRRMEKAHVKVPPRLTRPRRRRTSS
jgi:pilus assembly protein CpaE